MPPTVLVINPYATDFKLYDEWMHPLGLYFLASLLKNSGADVRFFNCLERRGDEKEKKFGTGDIFSVEIDKPELYRRIPRKYKLYGRPQKELIAFLSGAPEPDLICIGSMMTYWLPGVAETVRIVRSVHQAAPLVVGGIAARLMPAAVRTLAPDAALGGVLEQTGHGTPFSLGNIPVLPDSGPLSLAGGFTLLDRMKHGPALATLGCPFSCSYCASGLLQGSFRRRPAHLVKSEIRYCAERFGVVDFAWYDDALLFEPGRGVLTLLADLAAQEPAARFHAPNGLHLRFVDERVADVLKNARFATLRFGYESGDAGHGNDTGGKVYRSEVRSKIALLKSAGFDKKELGVYVMAGLPGQQPGSVIEEIDYLTSLGVQAKPVFISPVPETRLFSLYAASFPQIAFDPLWHNDTFFITRLPGWDWDATEEIRRKARELNQVPPAEPVVRPGRPSQ